MKGNLWIEEWKRSAELAREYPQKIPQGGASERGASHYGLRRRFQTPLQPQPAGPVQAIGSIVCSVYVGGGGGWRDRESGVEMEGKGRGGGR
jgi:hypothetical protein